MNENRHSKLGAFRGMDVTWLLDQWVERQPDKTCMIWAPFEGDGREWTYGKLARDAKRFASGLHNRGVGADDFVLIQMENCPEFIISWFGCVYLGAVPVTTNTRSVAENVRYFAEVMNPAAAVTEPALLEIVCNACGDSTKIFVTASSRKSSRRPSPPS